MGLSLLRREFLIASCRTLEQIPESFARRSHADATTLWTLAEAYRATGDTRARLAFYERFASKSRTVCAIQSQLLDSKSC